jgi:hypothetical protein
MFSNHNIQSYEKISHGIELDLHMGCHHHCPLKSLVAHMERHWVEQEIEMILLQGQKPFPGNKNRFLVSI